MDDLESKIASLSPAKRALLERKLRENAQNLETDPIQSPGHWSSLAPLQPKGTKFPFFWIYGDSTNFLLPAHLGPDQPLYGLQHQSLDGRPARYTRVETIAKHYLEELRAARPHGPYALGGYCFGAIVAFEMAQQLKKEGELVALIFMLDPPGARLQQAPAPISIPISEEIKRHWRQIAPLGPGGKMQYVLPRVSARTKWIRTAFAEAFAKLRWRYCLWSGRLLPVSLRSPYILDVYRRATQFYQPQPYPGPVVLFKAHTGPYRPQLNWFQLVTGKIEIHEHPGDHMALREEPQVRQWAAILKQALDREQKLVEKG
jgi:aspartate racemase